MDERLRHSHAYGSDRSECRRHLLSCICNPDWVGQTRSSFKRRMSTSHIHQPVAFHSKFAWVIKLLWDGCLLVGHCDICMVGTGQVVSDEKIVHDTMQQLNHFHSAAGPGAIALVETAGGVSSPTPSNSIQVHSSHLPMGLVPQNYNTLPQQCSSVRQGSLTMPKLCTQQAC